jgi:hypothetical protein
MQALKRIFPTISQRAVENLLLTVVAMALYSYSLSSIPPQIHHFEGWIDYQLLTIQQGWMAVWNEYSQLGQNDTNAAVRSPAWLALIFFSKMIFSNDLVAHRVPSVLLTALTPVLMAEIARQFYRKDMAFVVGLVTMGSQHLMFLGRIGGYVGPTTTLLAFIMLCAMKIAWGDERRAWFPFLLGMVLMPMFYSTIRYMSLLGVGIVALSFVRSRPFRRRHWLPCLVCSLVFLGYLSLFARGSLKDTFIEFFGARGEQYLITHQTLGSGGEQGNTVADRLLSVVTKKIPENFSNVLPNYLEGKRFFDWHYQALYHTVHTWLARLFFFGFGVGLLYSWSNPRYLLMIAWSILGWFPLLLTTGLTNNRMLVGIPADMFLLVTGAAFLGDVVIRLFGAWSKPIALTVMIGLASYVVYFSFYYFIFDCLRFCHL